MQYRVTYKRLWKMLIDRVPGVSSTSVTKMGKCGSITTEVLCKICVALDCSFDDIMEIVPAD